MGHGVEFRERGGCSRGVSTGCPYNDVTVAPKAQRALGAFPDIAASVQRAVLEDPARGGHTLPHPPVELDPTTPPK